MEIMIVSITTLVKCKNLTHTANKLKSNKLYFIDIIIYTASLVYGSACMIVDHKVVGLITVTSTILNVDLVWNGVRPDS